MELAPTRKESDEDHVQLLSEKTVTSCDPLHLKCLKSLHMLTEGGTVFDGFLLAGMESVTMVCVCMCE
jgi:hypothetical protein